MQNGIKILNFVRPAARKATYSESDDILPKVKMVEKKIDNGIAIGINVTATSIIKPAIKPSPISSDAMRERMRNISKVIKKVTKKRVLTISGKIRFDAINNWYILGK